MNRRYVLSFFVVLMLCVGAVAQAGKVERIGAIAVAESKPEITTVVEDKGYRVSIGNTAFGEIWFAKNLVDAKTGSASAVYPQFAKGTFVGVIRFLASAKDFRGQEIKPGTYTMRYDLLPSDGNHMGVAAQPDFVLLAPQGDDLDPVKPMSERVMVNLGKRTTGTAHPATFSLTPPDAAKEFPSVVKTSDGYVAFAAKLNLGGKEIPFAIVLQGQAAQ